MFTQPEIPGSVVYRLIKNPHMLPQVPTVLHELIEHTVHEKTVFLWHQESHMRRRDRLVRLRLELAQVVSVVETESDSEDEPMRTIQHKRRSSIVQRAYQC